jgi:hypothetical protein
VTDAVGCNAPTLNVDEAALRDRATMAVALESHATGRHGGGLRTAVGRERDGLVGERLACGRIDAPAALAAALKSVTGVVDHGLFLDLADLALVATDAGVMQIEP